MQEIDCIPVEELPKIEFDKPTLLEGAILVHGFRGNTNKPELQTVAELLVSRALITPSQRNVSQDERDRYQSVAPMDLQRLCFHCQYEGQNKDISYYYRGQALFAMPVKTAVGNVIVQDLQNGTTDIAIFSNDGVRIPINRGLILMTQSFFEEVKLLLNSVAEKSGINVDDLLNNNIMIVEDGVIGDPQKSWQKMSERIKPSEKVTYKMASYNTVNNWANKLLELYKRLAPATEEDLGI